MNTPKCPTCKAPLEEGQCVVGFEQSEPCLLCYACRSVFSHDDFNDEDFAYTEMKEFNLTHS
jgi:hypothetical protein